MPEEVHEVNTVIHISSRIIVRRKKYIESNQKGYSLIGLKILNIEFLLLVMMISNYSHDINVYRCGMCVCQKIHTWTLSFCIINIVLI